MSETAELIAESAAASEAAAASLEQTAAAATLPDQPRHSSPAYEASDADATMALVLGNLDLLFRRVDQQGKMLITAAEALHAVSSQMRVTMQLSQELIGQEDERLERLETAAAALIAAQERLSSRQTASE